MRIRRFAAWSIVAGLTLPVGALAHGLAEAAGLTRGRDASPEHALLAVGSGLAVAAAVLGLRAGGPLLRAALPRGRSAVVFIAAAQLLTGLGTLALEGGFDPARLALALAVAIAAACAGAFVFAHYERRVIALLAGVPLARGTLLVLRVRAAAQRQRLSAHLSVRRGRAPPVRLVVA